VEIGNRTIRWACVAVMGLALLASPATADDYAQDQAGHPLRIAAYVLHPIGWMIDFLIMQPAHKIGNSKPLQEFFGHRDDYPETESYAPAPEPIKQSEIPEDTEI